MSVLSLFHSSRNCVRFLVRVATEACMTYGSFRPSSQLNSSLRPLFLASPHISSYKCSKWSERPVEAVRCAIKASSVTSLPNFTINHGSRFERWRSRMYQSDNTESCFIYFMVFTRTKIKIDLEPRICNTANYIIHWYSGVDNTLWLFLISKVSSLSIFPLRVGSKEEEQPVLEKMSLNFWMADWFMSQYGYLKNSKCSLQTSRSNGIK